MSGEPVICFGQQPCGFFPKRFLYSKIITARRVQAELGGRIVFFLHDSDHDPRETQTVLRNRRTGAPAMLNFSFANKVQRKWAPLYLKRVAPEWRESVGRQLGAYVNRECVDLFRRVEAGNVADFCLEMYRGLGLLDGLTVVRSSDPEVRRAACDVSDYFVDVGYSGETVRARVAPGGLQLHEGGECHVNLPAVPFSKEQISPTRDTRLPWMQSVIHCTHYIAGAGEKAYLDTAQAPEITFLQRDVIDRSDEAWVPE